MDKTYQSDCATSGAEAKRCAGIDEAIRLACDVFFDKEDLDGKPAVGHALEVGRMGETEEEQIIGSGNATAIRVKINDLRHNLRRGRLTLERAREAGDSALVERITAINDKHERALALFGGTLDSALG